MLIILAVLGLAVIGFAVAIGAGWVRLASVDALAKPRITPSSAPVVPDAEDAEDDGSAGEAVPTTGPGHPAEAEGATAILPPQLADRAIVLHADQAKLTGPTTRLGGMPVSADPAAAGRLRPLGQCVTGMTDTTALAEWTFTVTAPGPYTVNLDYSTGNMEKGGKGLGGPYVLTVGEERIAGQITPTKSHRVFELIEIGTIQLAQGETRLTIRPDAKIKSGLFNLRSVRLIPAD